MKRKMPARVWRTFALLFFWVFYVFGVGLMYADGTLSPFVAMGYNIVSLFSFVGILGNFVAFAANNWQMPVKHYDGFALVIDNTHCVMTKATRCNWFGDRFRIHLPNSTYIEIVSIGDICITFGIVSFLVVLAVVIFTR
ncbi:MAG: DUF5317 family protein [Parcubacteria group bacterium]|nr:DUF5317 family protein [Parcubacteria group bacterium]MBI3074924.1 DUF5317 family protein [Parcubacteria group bacterium]